MPSTRYSQYTRDTVNRGMLNDRTTLEMECPIPLAPTIMPRSNSDNSRRLAMSRLAGVQPDSRENTSQLILLWAFQAVMGRWRHLKINLHTAIPWLLALECIYTYCDKRLHCIEWCQFLGTELLRRFRDNQLEWSVAEQPSINTFPKL
jgi:hypothetical protein